MTAAEILDRYRAEAVRSSDLMEQAASSRAACKELLSGLALAIGAPPIGSVVRSRKVFHGVRGAYPSFLVRVNSVAPILKKDGSLPEDWIAFCIAISGPRGGSEIPLSRHDIVDFSPLA